MKWWEQNYVDEIMSIGLVMVALYCIYRYGVDGKDIVVNIVVGFFSYMRGKLNTNGGSQT